MFPPEYSQGIRAKVNYQIPCSVSSESHNIMKKEKLIPRLYRVSKQQDKYVKKQAKQAGGESAFIRELITQHEKNNPSVNDNRA